MSISCEGYCFEDIYIGQEETVSSIVDLDKITQFAVITGDNNPVHLDADFAAQTKFQKIVAHGMLTASFVSTILGTKLPGPGCIFISQETQFKRPVFVDDHVTTYAKVIAMDAKKCFVTLETKCLVNDKIVLTGQAVAMVPSRKKQ